MASAPVATATTIVAAAASSDVAVAVTPPTVSSLTASVAYVERHYPALVVDASARRRFEFQERLRVAESKNFAANPERGARGWIAFDSIREAFADPAVVASLGGDDDDYVKATRAKIAQIDAEGGEAKQRNVRRSVRDVWMFPSSGFPEWQKLDAAAAAAETEFAAKSSTTGGGAAVEVKVESDVSKIAPPAPSHGAANPVAVVIAVANEILRKANAVPRLVNGQLSLALTGYRSALWAQCRERGIDLATLVSGLARPLVENVETEHVTLVPSSDVATRLGGDGDAAEKLTALLAKWSVTPLPLTVTGLMHTISLDWARFGVCLVTGIDLGACPELQAFVGEFNALFATKAPIRLPTPHITVAIDPR
jgi:hypothetical protein